MGIFTKKEKTKIIEPQSYPGAKKDREKLAKAAMPGAMERIGRAGETYPGDLTAPLSSAEEFGLGTLEDYLKSPQATEGGAFNLAQDELEKTLSGDEYDPVKGPYYQAYRTNLMREIQEAKDRLAARTSASDKFFGGGRIKGEADIEEAGMGELAMVLGQLFEKERQNRLGAVTQAGQMATLEETLPQLRIGASQQFGALPREIEQTGLDAEYQEWLRALGDLGIPLDVATGLTTYQPGVMVQQTGGGAKDWVKDTAGILSLVAALGGGPGFVPAA